MADLPPSFDAPPSFAPPPQQPPQQGGGLVGLGQEIATGLWHGAQRALPSDVLHQDPKTGKWITGEAQPQAQQPSRDWTTSISEFAGELAGGGPGAASKIGAAKAAGPVARAIESVTPQIGQQVTERWPSVTRAIGNVAQRIPGVRNTFLAATDPQTLRGAASVSSRRAAQAGAEEGSLAAARRTDVNLSEMGEGTWGLRGGGTPTWLERSSARLPGGGAVRRAITAADTRAQGLRADEIAQNLSASSSGGIATSASAYKQLSAAERQRIATFWRSGAPDRVWQALRDPQQVQFIQQATSVLSPNSRRYLAGEMLSRMGRTSRGAFNADQFLKEWGQMDGAARDAVFGSGAIRSDYARDVTELATNVQRIQAYASTAGPIRSAMAKYPKVSTAVTAVSAAGLALTAEHVLGGLLNMKTAGYLAAGSVTNLGLAQALTNPATVKWLARQSTKMVASYETAHGSNWATEVSPIDISSDLTGGSYDYQKAR